METVDTRIRYGYLRNAIAFLSGASVGVGVLIHNALSIHMIVLGAIAFAITLEYSRKDKIWEWVKTYMARICPSTASIDDIIKVAYAVNDPNAVAHGDMEEIPIPLIRTPDTWTKEQIKEVKQAIAGNYRGHDNEIKIR